MKEVGEQLQVLDTKGQGSKISGKYSNGKSEEFTLIGSLPKGRKAAVDDKGNIKVISHDGNILKSEYLEKDARIDQMKNNPEVGRNTTSALLDGMLDNATEAFEAQMAEDGWAADVADGISNLWGWAQEDGNQAWRVRRDLKEYKADIAELKQAASKNDQQAFNTKFKQMFGVDYNQKAVAAYALDQTEANYQKAFGSKNNIGARVANYNSSQQTGGAVVKGSATVAAGIAIGVATGGTGFAALGAAAVGSGASSFAINASDRMSSDVGLKEGEINDILGNAMWDGASVFVGGAIGKASATLIRGVNTASGVARASVNTVADVTMGAAQEYAQTGKITTEGTAMNAALGLVGMGVESNAFKQGFNKLKNKMHSTHKVDINIDVPDDVKKDVLDQATSRGEAHPSDVHVGESKAADIKHEVDAVVSNSNVKAEDLADTYKKVDALSNRDLRRESSRKIEDAVDKLSDAEAKKFNQLKAKNDQAAIDHIFDRHNGLHDTDVRKLTEYIANTDDPKVLADLKTKLNKKETTYGGVTASYKDLYDKIDNKAASLVEKPILTNAEQKAKAYAVLENPKGFGSRDEFNQVMDYVNTVSDKGELSQIQAMLSKKSMMASDKKKLRAAIQDRFKPVSSNINEYYPSPSAESVTFNTSSGMKTVSNAADVKSYLATKGIDKTLGNNVVNKLASLYEAQPKRFNKLANSGFFDLVSSGYIDKDVSARIFRDSVFPKDNKHVFLSNRFLNEVSIAADQIKHGQKPTLVKTLPKTDVQDFINTKVKPGETFEKDGVLYLKDENNKITKLNINKDQFDELFPPVSTSSFGQGAVGDCWLVSALDNLMEYPAGRSKLLKSFRQGKNNTIYVELPGANTATIFEKGIVLDAQGKQITGAKGIKMIEQAYMHHALSVNRKNLSPDQLAEMLDVPAQMAILEGGWSSEVWSTIFDTPSIYIDNVDQGLDFIAKRANNMDNMLSIAFENKNAGDARPLIDSQYSLYSNHAYAVKGYNPKTGMVYLTNPWQSSNMIEIPKDVVKKYYSDLEVMDMTNPSISSLNPEVQVPTSRKALESVSVNPKVQTAFEKLEQAVEKSEYRDMSIDREANTYISTILDEIKSGNVDNVEETLNSLDKLWKKASMISTNEYALSKSIKPYTINTLRRDLGLEIDIMTPRMERAMARSRYQGEIKDAFKELSHHLLAGELPSNKMLDEIVTKTLQGKDINPEFFKRDFLRTVDADPAWTSTPFKKPLQEMYPSHVKKLKESYMERIGIEVPKAPLPARVGLKGSTPDFFTQEELSFIKTNFADYSTAMQDGIKEALDKIGIKIQQGEMPRAIVVRKVLYEVGDKYSLNLGRLEENVYTCIESFPEWKPIKKHLSFKNPVEHSSELAVDVDTKAFRQAKGISGEYKPIVEKVSHEYEGIVAKSLTADEIKPITSTYRPSDAQAFVNIIDNIEWEITHGAVPSKNLIKQAIAEETLKNSKLAMKDPENLFKDIRSIITNKETFPEWQSLESYFFKNEDFSKELLEQNSPELVPEFIRLRKKNK